MLKKPGMDECILVCVYYGPNGERLIRRGHKMASMLNCPFYILTVDPLPFDQFDADKSEYVERWQELSEELGAQAFILRDSERLPSAKVIKEVAYDKNVTQIVIGQTAQSRWEEITKGSFINVLLREIPFADLHVVSVARTIKSVEEDMYEKGVRAYLIKDGEDYRVSFTQSKGCEFEGIFFKEIGTDFNNGIFKFMHDHKMCQVHVDDDRIEESRTVERMAEEKHVQ
ncbi:Universal stress protein family protein [Bhargavaea ginsengi]|uniref:Universal stress protein family protein n=1 Tax=Bhargavaea ginsengi TaxID=426757 RepID=A0A1H7BEE1_9BACL|nr:histidine kinase [Bhargavaea ginsengi]SEJ75828.1 Universal stress protein family protein [Bhargavaea ginsengi]